MPIHFLYFDTLFVIYICKKNAHSGESNEKLICRFLFSELWLVFTIYWWYNLLSSVSPTKKKVPSKVAKFTLKLRNQFCDIYFSTSILYSIFIENWPIFMNIVFMIMFTCSSERIFDTMRYADFIHVTLDSYASKDANKQKYSCRKKTTKNSFHTGCSVLIRRTFMIVFSYLNPTWAVFLWDIIWAGIYSWNQTNVCLVPNQSENSKCNLISGWFNNI